MKVLALTIIICLEILHGQKVTRPDPPPGYNNKNPSRPDLGRFNIVPTAKVCSTAFIEHSRTFWPCFNFPFKKILQARLRGQLAAEAPFVLPSRVLNGFTA